MTNQILSLDLNSSGRSLKGSLSETNSDYICYSNYPGTRRVKGIYSIATGVRGKKDLASETAIETIKQCVREIHDSDSTNGSNLLPGCFEEVANALSSDEQLSSSLICGYIEGTTLHIGLAGGGAAYVIENGKISRLTEDIYIPDLDNTDPGIITNGQIPAGWYPDRFGPMFSSFAINNNSTILLCSESFIARVDSPAILNIVSNASSLDEAADMLVQEAHRRDNSTDVSIVLVKPVTQNESKTSPYEEVVKYSFFVYLRKYITVTMIMILLGCAFIYVPGIVVKNRPGVPDQPTPTQMNEISTTGSESMTDNASTQTGSTFSLHVEPEGAAVFIDGTLKDIDTDNELRVPSNKEFELRIEAEGYQTYIEHFNIPEGSKIERVVSLVSNQPSGGSFLVFCRPDCDSMELDGKEIKGFPREEILMREIKPGLHKITVKKGSETQNRSLRVETGITQSIVFRFGDNKFPGPKTQAVMKSAPVKTVDSFNSDIEVVTTNPESEPVAGETIIQGKTIDPSPENFTQLDRSFFSVNTNVSGCSIMVFQAGVLKLTGFCDKRYELKPGKYLFQVSKPGYIEKKTEFILSEPYQTIDLELRQE
ncbi:MAG TPA: hypothetical protein PLN69_00600 [bacterium]|nr:hypothetical protein [bacterium]